MIGRKTYRERIVMCLYGKKRGVVSRRAVMDFLKGGWRVWSRSAFRRALELGVEEGVFVKVRDSYRLSSEARRAEKKRRKEGYWRWRAKKLREYEREDYDKWLDEQGYMSDTQRQAMWIAHEHEHGLMDDSDDEDRWVG